MKDVEGKVYLVGGGEIPVEFKGKVSGDDTAGVESFGGQTGVITLGTGLSMSGKQLIAAQELPELPSDYATKDYVLHSIHGTLAWVVDLPALPEDALTKTYALQAVNSVLTWVEVSH